MKYKVFRFAFIRFSRKMRYAFCVILLKPCFIKNKLFLETSFLNVSLQTLLNLKAG